MAVIDANGDMAPDIVCNKLELVEADIKLVPSIFVNNMAGVFKPVYVLECSRSHPEQSLAWSHDQ